MHTYDVIIVGAGPVGLATAIGLCQRGIENILVLDRAKVFRRVGQSLDILPNGLKALKYLDTQAYEEVKKSAGVVTHPENSSQPSPKWFFRDLQGKPIRSIILNYNEWFQNYGEGRLNITWFDLQTTLRNVLLPELVKANHHCIHVAYEPENECVRVDCLSDMTVGANPYAHWSSSEESTQDQPQNINNTVDKLAPKSFQARLVVAADGINSTVRKVLYKDTAYEEFSLPEYSGYVAIICSEIADISKDIETEIQEKFLQNAPVVTITQDANLRDSASEETPRMMLSKRSDKFAYLIHIPVALKQLQEKSLINLALEQLEKNNFPKVIKELVRISNPANMQHRTYYMHRANISDSFNFPATANLPTQDNSEKRQSPWYMGKVVLVGDAAHGMPPFAAQGVNQGLEDAATIVKLIARLADLEKLNDIKAIQQAFNKYENLRRPLMEYVQKVTMTGLNYSTNKEQLDKYNQQIFSRDLEQVLETLT